MLTLSVTVVHEFTISKDGINRKIFIQGGSDDSQKSTMLLNPDLPRPTWMIQQVIKIMSCGNRRSNLNKIFFWRK